MFGWVDFTDEERRRASEVMNLVRYPGAIDELGFGVLRDAFAGRLFPATSTLHTHARYYYLVSYLMKDIERKGAGKPIETLQQMQREGEIETARKLLAWTGSNNVEATGITGSDSLDSGWVKMTPASMDWAAIQRLGLFKDPDMKLNGFLRSVSAEEKGSSNNLLSPSESAESSAEYSSGSLWNVPLGIYRTWNEGEEISLWLHRDEALDLRARIKQLFPNTAYAYLLNAKSPSELRQSIAEPTFGETSFINLVESDSLSELDCPPDLIAICNTAADLASLVALLHIRFNHVLRRKADVADFESDYASILWNEFAYSDESVYHRRTAQLNIGKAFLESNAPLTNERNARTRSFLEDAQEAYLNKDLAKLDELIERREVALKGEMRSKIANAKAYASEWFGGLELTYRLGVAFMVATEINMAMEASDD